MSLPQPSFPDHAPREDFSKGRSRPEFYVADLRALALKAAQETGRQEAGRHNDPAPLRGKRVSGPAIIAAVLLFDLGNFLASGMLTYRYALNGAAPDMRLLAWGLALVVALGLAVLQGRWTYTIRALGDFSRQSLGVAVAFTIAVGAFCAASVLFGVEEIALVRQWSASWMVSGVLGGIFARAVIARAVSSWTKKGLLARRTVVVGGGEQALATIQRLENSGKGALDILGIFDDRDRTRLPKDMGRYRMLGTFDDLESFCRTHKVDLLIVAFPLTAEARILHVLQKLWALPVDVRISALGGKLRLRDRAYNFIGDVPFLPAFDKPMADWEVALKAIFDRCVALLAIVALSPVMLAVALGVRLSSPGPILFRQKRYGFNNEEFGVFKFRSMYTDKCDLDASKLVTRGDSRVTPFGAFIRRTSLDELPQFFNVLFGDLSLVGPRPHALKGNAAGQAYEKVVDNYFARHRVKPGITGWAQINGWRGETDTVEKIEQRVAHDLHYIEHWSIWMDIKILIKTPFVVLLGTNAF